MTNEKIFEIARIYGSYESVHYEDDEPTQFRFEWAFEAESLIAFAQSVIEAERDKRKKLTDEEIFELIRNSNALEPNGILPKTFIREIEKAHGIGEEE